MAEEIDSRFASTEFLTARAKRRVPRFAFEYLSGGCFSEVNLARNTDEIRDLQLQPCYTRDFAGVSQKVTLFGMEYDAPFGIAPVGLQGLVWPRSCEILAKAAADHNVPFCLSTVGTADIETIGEITEGKAWFQLYHPTDDDLRDKLIDRAWEAGLRTLVILADTPTFGWRPKEMRNGLSIPPRMNLRNILQMLSCPTWALQQLRAGAPSFKTMEPYIPPGLNMAHLGLFMNKTFSGRLTGEKIKALRERWKGNLVVKGIVNPEDADRVLSLGVDGFIVSNHGGRQLDAGPSTIRSLQDLADGYRSRTTVMFDSGLRSGSDIAIALASGAHFAFLGRTPMYGVMALGEKGGHHALTMLKRQLQQVMEQLACERVEELPGHLLED